MSKHIHINPILKKDMIVSARNARMAVTITLINLLALIVVGVAFLSGYDSTFSDNYYAIVTIFPVLAFCELAVVSLVIPVLTATSISGERERQTLDIMLTTTVKPVSIVLGKLLSAVAVTLMYVVSSLPFLAIAFMVGGLNWSDLFRFVGAVVFVGIYAGSFGIFYSCRKRTSVSATIATIAMLAAIIILTVGTAVVMSDYTGSYNDNTAEYTYNYVVINIQNTLLLLNPAAWIAELFCGMLYNSSIYDLWYFTNKGAYSDFVRAHFELLSLAVNLVIAAVVLLLAVRRIVSGRTEKRRKRKTPILQKGV